MEVTGGAAGCSPHGMSVRILALLAVLLGGALLIGRLARIGGSGPDTSGMAPGAGEVMSSTAEITLAAKDPIEGEAPALSGVGTQPLTSQREPQRPSLDGLLVFPPGTPADESIQLVVSGCSSNEPRSVVVSSDGTFQVGGSLEPPLRFALEARYLRLAGVDPEREGELWVLRPRLGARVVGHVVAPWSSEQPVRSNVYVGRLPSTMAEWDALDEPIGRRRPTYLGWVENQVDEFAFDALPVGVPLVAEAFAYLARPVRERMTLAPGETRRIVFAPTRAVTLAGTLVSAVESDLSEYTLRVHHLQEDGHWSTVHSEVLQDHRGVFRIGGLPPGRLCLTADDDSSRAEIVLDTGPGDVEGIVLEVDRPNTIAGFVVWTDGELVGDPVDLLAESDGPGHHQAGTDAGKFMFDKTAPGAIYRVHAELTVTSGLIAKSGTVTVTAPAEGVRLVLPRPARLEGVVTTAAGTPVPSAFVCTTLGPYAKVGDDGRFRILVPPGAHRLSAYAEGHPPSKMHPVVLGPGESIEGLELILGSRGARIRGKIVDEWGAPIAARMRVSVEREPANGSPFEPFTASTDTHGAFVIANLPVGTFFVSATQSHPSGDNPVEVSISRGSLLGVRERKWRVGPELVRLAEGADHFVLLTALRDR